ncbi:MAG: universal stress protein [Cyanobacteria bacterium SZAS LIN-5]|nr:universal stress protein [Cyanobacteria bacterium SZAS LIN-5]
MRILFATDLSPHSQASADALISMRYGRNDEIKVLTVVELFEPFFAVHAAEAAEQAQAHVQSVAATILQHLPYCKVSAESLAGYPDQVIIDTAAAFKADLIVIGSHGRSALTRFLWGSTSRAVALNAACPVRIVKNGHQTRSPKNVVIALDESPARSEQTEYVIEHVLKASWPDGVRYKCVTALKKEHGSVLLNHNSEDSLLKEAKALKAGVEEALQNHVARLNSEFGDNCACYEIVYGDAREQIINAAEAFEAGLIVLGSHSQRTYKDIVFGSVADAVSSHAECSVEIVKHYSMKKAKMHVIV